MNTRSLWDMHDRRLLCAPKDRALGWCFCSYNHLFQSLRQACKDITAIGPICRWGNGGSEESSGLCKSTRSGPVAELGFWPRPVLLTTLHPVYLLSFDGQVFSYVLINPGPYFRSWSRNISDPRCEDSYQVWSVYFHQTLILTFYT